MFACLENVLIDWLLYDIFISSFLLNTKQHWELKPGTRHKNTYLRWSVLVKLQADVLLLTLIKHFHIPPQVHCCWCLFLINPVAITPPTLIKLKSLPAMYSYTLTFFLFVFLYFLACFENITKSDRKHANCLMTNQQYSKL